jgi:hypothetical protein
MLHGAASGESAIRQLLRYESVGHDAAPNPGALWLPLARRWHGGSGRSRGVVCGRPNELLESTAPK